jgi:chromosome segregation ATPase
MDSIEQRLTEHDNSILRIINALDTTGQAILTTDNSIRNLCLVLQGAIDEIQSLKKHTVQFMNKLIEIDNRLTDIESRLTNIEYAPNGTKYAVAKSEFEQLAEHKE